MKQEIPVQRMDRDFLYGQNQLQSSGKGMKRHEKPLGRHRFHFEKRPSQPPPAAHLLLVIDWKSRKREDHNMVTEIQKVPIHLKMTLTIKEAAEYSNIGINKIESLLRTPNCPFVLYVGTKSWSSERSLKSSLAKKL